MTSKLVKIQDVEQGDHSSSSCTSSRMSRKNSVLTRYQQALNNKRFGGLKVPSAFVMAVIYCVLLGASFLTVILLMKNQMKHDTISLTRRISQEMLSTTKEDLLDMTVIQLATDTQQLADSLVLGEISMAKEDWIKTAESLYERTETFGLFTLGVVDQPVTYITCIMAETLNTPNLIMTGPCAEGTGVFNITLCAINGIDVTGTLDYTVIGYEPNLASDALINIPADVDTYANIVYAEISGEIGLLYAIRIYDYAGNSVAMALSGISPEQSVSDMLAAHIDDNSESGRRLWTINEENGNMTAASTGSVSETHIIGTSEMKYYLLPTSEDVDPSIRQISLDLGGDLLEVERDVLLETSTYFVMATEIPFDAMGPETSDSAWVLFSAIPKSEFYSDIMHSNNVAITVCAVAIAGASVIGVLIQLCVLTIPLRRLHGEITRLLTRQHEQDIALNGSIGAGDQSGTVVEEDDEVAVWHAKSMVHKLALAYNRIPNVITLTEVENLKLLYIKMQLQTEQFKQFVDYPITQYVSHCLETGQSLRMKKVEGTIIFCDVEGFSLIMDDLHHDIDKIANFMDLLTAVLTKMVTITHDNHGFRDKLVGDAMMLCWGPPWNDACHSLNACKAALSMMRYVKAMGNANSVLGKFLRENNTRIKTLKMRFGMASGSMISGVMSGNYPVYTSYGQAVNHAARLEGQVAKLFGAYLICTEDTITHLQRLGNTSNICYHWVANACPSGAKDPIRIFVIYGDDTYAVQYGKTFEDGMVAYYQGNGELARTYFKTVKQGGYLVNLCKHMRKLSAQLANNDNKPEPVTISNSLPRVYDDHSFYDQ